MDGTAAHTDENSPDERSRGALRLPIEHGKLLKEMSSLWWSRADPYPWVILEG